MELAGRRFARLRLGGVENLSCQIARTASPSMAVRVDRRRRDAGFERRRSKTASATTKLQSAELCDRTSTDRRHKRRRVGRSKSVSGRERQTFDQKADYFEPVIHSLAC